MNAEEIKEILEKKDNQWVSKNLLRTLTYPEIE